MREGRPAEARGAALFGGSQGSHLAKAPFEEGVARLLAGTKPFGPDWLAGLRAEGAAAVRASGLPTLRHEDWRFTSLSPLAALSFGTEVLSSSLPAESLPQLGGPRLVFAANRLRPDLSSLCPLPAGAVVTSLAEALSRSPEKVRPHLGRLARPEGLFFTGLNTALFEDGAFVYLPPGAVLDAPITLVFEGGGGAAPALHHPRVLVVAGEGARASVVEIFLGGGDDVYLTDAVTELVLEDGAEIDHVKLQGEGDRAFHLSSVFAEQGAGTRLGAHVQALGAQLSRAELRVRLGGEGGSLEATGLYLADGNRVTDAFTVVDHVVPRCATSESYKGILDGRAHGVFAGRIRVMKDAQKTDARQMNSNLLLSDEAVVDTRPQLEILADDVKCGHGGTVGQLDEDALFYLRSRGLLEADAKRLLIWAFANGAVLHIRPKAVRERARAELAGRLGAAPALLEAA